MRIFIMEFDSHDFGGWEVSWYTICKLENQKHLWYNSVRDKSLRTKEVTGLSPRVGEDQEPGVLMSNARRWIFQLQERKNTCLPLPFCSVRALNWLDDACPHWEGESSLLSLLNPVLMSYENTLTDTLKNNILHTSYLGTPWLSQVVIN